jgi:hypothetical protein
MPPDMVAEADPDATTPTTPTPAPDPPADQDMTGSPPPAPAPAQAPAPAPAPAPAVPTPVNVASVKPYDGGRVFTSQVVPILRSRCYECHGSDKTKGDLRLDSAAAIRDGGKSGPAVLAGNPERSHLYQLVTLPPDDPDVMPSEGDPLTDREKAVLQRWILEGAHMDDGEHTASIAVAQNEGGNFLIDQLSQQVSPPNPVVVQALEQAEVQFRGLSANGAFIKVDFSHVPRTNPLNLQDLAPIAANIWHLDLSRTRVTDQELAHIADLPNLRKLELNNTKVTDTGLAHLQGLKSLETLNLYGTSVTDAGLRSLEPLAGLKQIHLFMTNTTEAGANALREKIPGLETVLN